MRKRISYYAELEADYSRPGPVSREVGDRLIKQAETILAKKERHLPAIDQDYTVSKIEQENRDWWPTRCEALRRGRGDILGGECHDDFVYLCQDGPFFGLQQKQARELHWWALIAQPGASLVWPIVMFSGEVVYFEWKCLDDATNESIAKGSVTLLRRGHRGGCHVKTEQLTFYRDVFASEELIRLVTT
jgi:hypothetical protein